MEETAPLLPPPVTAPTTPARARRTVTFNENPVTKTIEPDEYPRASLRNYGSAGLASSSSSSSSHMMTAAPLGGISSNSTKIRRRGGAPGIASPGGGAPSSGPSGSTAPTSALSTAVAHPGMPKIGPQRSTKTAQKLKELPLPDFGDEGPDEESGREVYSQYTRIKDPKARRDAARLGKADRDRLPRVTAYCTANKYQLESLTKWLRASARKRGANPKRIDECLYSSFSYTFRRDQGLVGSREGSENPTPLDSGSQTPIDGEEDMLLTPSTPGTPYGDPFGRHEMFPPIPTDDSGVGMTNSELRNEVQAAMAGEGSQNSSGSSARVAEGGEVGGRAVQEASPGTQRQPSPPQQQQQQQERHTTNTGEGTAAGGAATTTSPSPLSTSTSSDVLDIDENPDLDVTVDIPEIFLFEYGVVVIWGMTEPQELKLLKDISRWSPVERLDEEQIEAEYFNFYYTRDYQARIYNDFIALRRSDKKNYMTKLAISHGLAQSVKTNLYEELIAVELEGSKDLPAQIAMAGKMAMSKTEINMKIGKLFILRIQVHLNGSVLDTPELFWTEPHLEPVYQATRRYLEMDQRIEVLANRLSVIGDLLTVLKDQLSHGHGEMLEWIVIILIAAEILVAVVNIIVDVYAGVDA